MSRRRSAASYNKMLMSYTFWPTEAAALEHAKQNRWRKYVLSSNAAGDCWTLYHKTR